MITIKINFNGIDIRTDNTFGDIVSILREREIDFEINYNGYISISKENAFKTLLELSFIYDIEII